MPTPTATSGIAFWRLPLAGLLEQLGATPDGLSRAEATARLAKFGPNVTSGERKRAVILQFLAKFRNPLVSPPRRQRRRWLTGDLRSFTVISVRGRAECDARLRPGAPGRPRRRAPAPGRAGAGDGAPRRPPGESRRHGPWRRGAPLGRGPGPRRRSPAGSARLFVNQALLTGEPYPIEKHRARPGQPRHPTGPNAVLMGSSIVSGCGRALIVRTGAATALGEIGASLTRTPPPRAFEQGTRAFGLLILRLALLMVAFVLLVNAWRERPLLQSFLFAVALAVGLTPELLPMVISVSLSRGALRMAARKVLVKRLAAIHDLGSMDVLCTDKTGTLTEGANQARIPPGSAGVDSPRVLELAYLNSRFETGLRTPLDDAILRHEEVDVRGWTKLDEVPFDFERRRISVLLQKGDDPPLLAVKGAFEDILAHSTHYEAGGPDDVRPLDEAARVALQGRFEALARQGFRVLGIAHKARPRGCASAALADEAELVFAGLAAFQDPPKESACRALGQLADLGIAVKVLTGDNELWPSTSAPRSACRPRGSSRAPRSRTWTTRRWTRRSNERACSAG